MTKSKKKAKDEIKLFLLSRRKELVYDEKEGARKINNLVDRQAVIKRARVEIDRIIRGLDD